MDEGIDRSFINSFVIWIFRRFEGCNFNTIQRRSSRVRPLYFDESHLQYLSPLKRFRLLP